MKLPGSLYWTTHHSNGSEHMQEQAKRWLAGALVVVVIVAVWRMWQSPPSEVKPGAASAVGILTLAQAPAYPKSAPASVMPMPDAPYTAFNGESDEPVGMQVQRLIATNEGQQAFAAYWLLLGCMSFNQHHEINVYDDKLHANRRMNAAEQRHARKVCGSMTERERQARLDYLAMAVKARVPSAAWIFATEGPFGDPSALKTRPDDPLVQAWKATATAQLVRDAERGDPATLIAWGMVKLNGSDFTDKDAVGAYGYLLAFGMIQADRQGLGDTGAQVYAEGSTMMNALAAGLTPQQRTTALGEARRIAAAVKAGKIN